MKIVCDACGTKYSIGDDRVAGKVFKIRCKKCSQIIVVRGTPAAVAEPTPEPAPIGDWHFVADGEQVGPLTREELLRRHAAGELDDDSFVWRDGMDEWAAFHAVAELRDAALPRGESTAVTPMPAAPAPAAIADALPAAAEPAPRLLAERNESSVLFTLGNLAKLAADPSVSAAPATSAKGATANEGSGLIDIRQLASTFTAKPTAKTATPIGSLDDLPTFAPTTFGEPIVLAPAMRATTDRRLLFALMGVLGLLAVVGIVLVVVMMRSPDKSDARGPQVAQGPGGNETTNDGTAGTSGLTRGTTTDGTSSNGASTTGANGMSAAGANSASSGASGANGASTSGPNSATGASTHGASHGANGASTHGANGTSNGAAENGTSATGTPTSTSTRSGSSSSRPGSSTSSSRPGSSSSRPGSSSSSTTSSRPGSSSTSTSTTSTSTTRPGTSTSTATSTTTTPTTRPTTAPDRVQCEFSNFADKGCEIYKPAASTTANSNLPDNLDRNAIATGLGTIRAQGCGNKSSARGDVSVTIKVNADGGVAGVTVKSSPDPILSACVTAAAQKGTFAKTKRGASFGYVWRF